MTMRAWCYVLAGFNVAAGLLSGLYASVLLGCVILVAAAVCPDT